MFILRDIQDLNNFCSKIFLRYNIVRNKTRKHLTIFFQMSFSKTKKLIIGLTALSGVATFHYYNFEKSTVQLSWTTNYTPSQFAKWDENWDQYVKTIIL